MLFGPMSQEVKAKPNKEKTNKKLIELMFSVGAHYGYSKSRRHPSTGRYIFGLKNKVEIFDLEKTSLALEEALLFVKELASKNGIILFVSGKKEASKILRSVAENLSLPVVAGRWIGGTLTNFSEIKKRISRFLNLKAKREKGELEKYTKKERLLIDREIDELDMKFGGIVSMKELPDALFVVDSKEENTAVREARSLNIPVISLSGSDCNLEEVDYPIPGNDSSLSSIEFFISRLEKAYKEGGEKTGQFQSK